MFRVLLISLLLVMTGCTRPWRAPIQHESSLRNSHERSISYRGEFEEGTGNIPSYTKLDCPSAIALVTRGSITTAPSAPTSGTRVVASVNPRVTLLPLRYAASCEAATDAIRKAYVEAAISAETEACSKFFFDSEVAVSHRRFFRSSVINVGGFSTAVLGLAGAPAAVVGGAGALTAATATGVTNYDTAYMVAPDLPEVEKLVVSAQEAMRKELLARDYKNWWQADMARKSFANICTFNVIRGLVTQSVASARLTVVDQVPVVKSAVNSAQGLLETINTSTSLLELQNAQKQIEQLAGNASAYRQIAAGRIAQIRKDLESQQPPAGAVPDLTASPEPVKPGLGGAKRRR